MHAFLGYIEYVLRENFCLVVTLFSLRKGRYFTLQSYFQSPEGNKQKKKKQAKRQKQTSIPSKMNAVTFKLQLHFSLPREQPRQGRGLLLIESTFRVPPIVPGNRALV